MRVTCIDLQQAAAKPADPLIFVQINDDRDDGTVLIGSASNILACSDQSGSRDEKPPVIGVVRLSELANYGLAADYSPLTGNIEVDRSIKDVVRKLDPMGDWKMVVYEMQIAPEVEAAPPQVIPEPQP